MVRLRPTLADVYANVLRTFTNYMSTTDGKGTLTIVCKTWRNKCAILVAGRSDTAEFEDMSVKISAPPNGYNLVKPVDF